MGDHQDPHLTLLSHPTWPVHCPTCGYTGILDTPTDPSDQNALLAATNLAYWQQELIYIRELLTALNITEGSERIEALTALESKYNRPFNNSFTPDTRLAAAQKAISDNEHTLTQHTIHCPACHATRSGHLAIPLEVWDAAQHH